MPSLKRLFRQDWLCALILLGIFLATNRYVYAWDDQHLEIPLLKHLIDPTLYRGDYYVESLARNFTSYLFPILAKVITVDQIPMTYLVLFLLSRFFLFYWSFKLWDLLAQRYFGADQNFSTRWAAFAAVVMSILIGRTEEFLYRTFSHQEFALAIIFAAVYYFFKDRYVVAAWLFGIAANFHALYALFPMTYMSFYLLFFHPEKRIVYFVKTGLAFVVACLPFLLWAIPRNIDLHMTMPADLTKNWVEMYYLACPQNFPFGKDAWDKVMGNYKLLAVNVAPLVMMMALYIIHALFNPAFRRDRKIMATGAAVTLYVAACYYFSYGHPSRLALDLNLIRNEQYLRYLMMGYTTILAVYQIQKNKLASAFLWAVILMFLWFRGPFALLIVSASAVVLMAIHGRSIFKGWTPWKTAILTSALAGIAIGAWFAVNWPMVRIDKLLANGAALALLVIYVIYEVLAKRKFRHWFVTIPFFFAFLFFCYYHYQYVEITTKGAGFWQLQRNWEDMQEFVRKTTPKDALILTPYNMEMGGFRIKSERRVLVCYRDCGIVGFDYQAALEWQQRVKDIESYKVITDPNSIGPAIVNALYKYNVDYVVFMRYYAPDNNALVRKLYENEVFALYKVVLNRS